MKYDEQLLRNISVVFHKLLHRDFRTTSVNVGEFLQAGAGAGGGAGGSGGGGGEGNKKKKSKSAAARAKALHGAKAGGMDQAHQSMGRFVV